MRSTLALGVRFESPQLCRPKALDLIEPTAKLDEGFALEPVHAHARVVFGLVFGDETRLAQQAQVPAHGGARHRKRSRDLARATRLLAKKVDDLATRGVGESRE